MLLETLQNIFSNVYINAILWEYIKNFEPVSLFFHT